MNEEISLKTLMENSTMKKSEIKKVEKELPNILEDVNQVDRNEIEKIKGEIDFQNTHAIGLYGSGAQKSISHFSRQMLNEMKSSSTMYANDLITDTLRVVESMSITRDDGGILSKLPFFKAEKKAVEDYLDDMRFLSSRLEKIKAQLEDIRMDLMKDIAIFDRLYEENLKSFVRIQNYITAGDEKVSEAREDTLPRLGNEAKQSNNPNMALQLVKDYEESVDRFDRRLHSLKTSKMIALQTAPQIKLLQKTDKLLIDKITDILNNTLPLWENQMIIALGLEKERTIYDYSYGLSNSLAQALNSNASDIKKISQDLAKEIEQSDLKVKELEDLRLSLAEKLKEGLDLQKKAEETRNSTSVEVTRIDKEIDQSIKSDGKEGPIPLT